MTVNKISTPLAGKGLPIKPYVAYTSAALPFMESAFGSYRPAITFVTFPTPFSPWLQGTLCNITDVGHLENDADEGEIK